MSSDWRIVRIGTLLEEGVILVHKDGNHGSNYPKAEEFGREGVPFLTAKLLDDAGNIDIVNAPRLASEKADKFKFGFVEADDVLLSHNATVGRVAVVPRIQERVLIGTSLTQFRLDKNILLPRYLAAYFSSRDFQNQLAAVMSQTTRNQVPITSQRTLSIVIPTFSEQGIIADFLQVFDDRITLLRETNTTLEAIAQALFKSWFVDFDPVRAKQEGREPEGMDADTAALFPDSFEESELGLVPKGWQAGKVDTVLTRLPAKVRYTKDQIATDGVTPIYEQGAGILLGYHEGKAQYLADENDPAFIFGDHTCVTHLSCEPFDISQNVIVLKGKDRATLWVYYAVKDKQTFQEYRRHWMELIVKDIVIPSAQICDAFAKNVNSYHLKMESNVRQSRTLTTLRNTLLPRLISGQLRLPDAEALIEEATA